MKVSITVNIDLKILQAYSNITERGTRSAEIEQMMVEKIAKHEKKASKKATK